MQFFKRLYSLSENGFAHMIAPLAVIALIAVTGGYFYLYSSRAATVVNANYFQSGITGKCLDLWRNSKAVGNKVNLYTCNKTAAQQWTIKKNGTNVMLVNVDGMCLDVWQAKRNNFSPVKIYPCSVRDVAEQWQLAANNEIVNPFSGKCLDDPAFSTVNGRQLVIWTCNGGKNQQWTPVPISASTGSTGGGGNSGTPTPTPIPTPTPTPTPTPSGGGSGFIYTNGMQLMQNGQPYRSIGFNFSPVGSCWNSNWSTAQMDQFFQSIPRNSLARFFAPPGGTDSASFVEQIVHEADKYNDHMIISLAVAGVYGQCDAGDSYSTGSGKTAGYYTAAVQSGSAYYNWVHAVVTPLAKDPGVAMWEIVNEPWHGGATISQAGGVSGATTYTNAAASIIRSAETAGAGSPKQLITLGPADIGETGGTSGMESIFKNIDVIDDHDYSGDQGGSNQFVNNEFPQLQQIAQALKKPYMVDETGVEAGTSCSSSNIQNAWDNRSAGIGLQSRVNFLLNQKATDYIRSGASAVEFWLYTTPGQQESGCVYENITPSDPLMSAVMNYKL